MRSQKTIILSACLGCGIFLLTMGCAKKPVIKEKAKVTPEQPRQEAAEFDIRDQKFVVTEELLSIYFGFDRSEIREDMREVLAKNAKFLKTHPKIGVRVDGHCDERGTTEYNLGLGQRRAAATRAYYINLGVGPARLGTLSWGEEKSLCSEKTETCWDKNRRAETLIQSVGNNNAQAK